MITVSGHPAEPPNLHRLAGDGCSWRHLTSRRSRSKSRVRTSLTPIGQTFPPQKPPKPDCEYPLSALPISPCWQTNSSKGIIQSEGKSHSNFEVREPAQAIMSRKRDTPRADRAPPACKKIPAPGRLFQPSQKAKVARISPTQILPNLIWCFNISLKINSV